MKRLFAVCCFVLSFAAFADTTPTPAPAMDMSKVGPASRKPSDEKKLKKEIDAWFKAGDEIEAKHDMDGMLGRVDFPVFMVTDDAKGAIEAKSWSKDEYVAMMKPMMENMPKDSKTTHKPSVTILSDSLVSVNDEFTMTAGKMKVTGKNAGLLAKVDGSWKWKYMVEAGWGGMGPAAAPEGKATAAAPAAKPAAPAPAPAPAPVPAPAPAKK